MLPLSTENDPLLFQVVQDIFSGTDEPVLSAENALATLLLEIERRLPDHETLSLLRAMEEEIHKLRDGVLSRRSESHED